MIVSMYSDWMTLLGCTMMIATLPISICCPVLAESAQTTSLTTQQHSTATLLKMSASVFSIIWTNPGQIWSGENPFPLSYCVSAANSMAINCRVLQEKLQVVALSCRSLSGCSSIDISRVKWTVWRLAAARVSGGRSRASYCSGVNSFTCTWHFITLTHSATRGQRY